MSDEEPTGYAIKQVGDRYCPGIIDSEAGGHYEIKNPLTGGVLSYKNVEGAEISIERAPALFPTSTNYRLEQKGLHLAQRHRGHEQGREFRNPRPCVASGCLLALLSVS